MFPDNRSYVWRWLFRLWDQIISRKPSEMVAWTILFHCSVLCSCLTSIIRYCSYCMSSASFTVYVSSRKLTAGLFVVFCCTDMCTQTWAHPSYCQHCPSSSFSKLNWFHLMCASWIKVLQVGVTSSQIWTQADLRSTFCQVSLCLWTWDTFPSHVGMKYRAPGILFPGKSLLTQIRMWDMALCHSCPALRPSPLCPHLSRVRMLGVIGQVCSRDRWEKRAAGAASCAALGAEQICFRGLIPTSDSHVFCLIMALCSSPKRTSLKGGER